VRSYKGSGLGIPIAYGIIKLLNGAVAVESQPEQGTTFTVTLTGMG
jgi:signal transduction histidine kinase